MVTKKRFLRKFKASPLFKVLKIVGILAAVALFFYVLVNLNIFYIQKITVSGISDKELKYVDKNFVEELTSDYIGKRYFEVNPDEIKQKIEESIYFDYEIYVTKQFPDEIEISIQERIPKLKVIFDSYYFLEDEESEDNQNQEIDSSNESCLLIDSEKKVLDYCSNWSDQIDALIECVIALPLENNNKPGDDLYSTEVSFISELNDSLSDRNIEVDKYLVPSSNVVVVELGDSTSAIFNIEKQLELQISEFEYSKENAIIQGKSFKEIDLRFDKPVLRVDKGTEWVTE